jgi:membrane-bound lytic murein transglycosylase A
MAQTNGNAGAAGATKPPGAVKLPPKFLPMTFADLPGWQQDDHAAAFKAFVLSCDKVLSATRAGNKAGATPISPGLLSTCDLALKMAAKRVPEEVARAFFESQFTPHRVEHAGPPGLLTGYYEPLISGSRTPSAKFPTPIHRRPPDLVNIVEESMRGAKSDALTHGRKSGNGIVPYATRADIEQGSLKGRSLELLYLSSAVDKFFLQIQGSGRIKLTDGTLIRISYDGKNGHPYTSIGRHLIDTGLFPADKMSLEALGNWLKADTERGRKVMWLNKSYVFFRELQGEEAKGALGVLNIPLTPGRSLAVDAGFHAIGTPVFVSAPTLTHVLKVGGFQRLMIAQDVGSAIKGPERGDIYFGSGNAAGKLAGVTKHPGNLFVLLPRGSDPDVAKRPETSKAASNTPAGSGGGSSDFTAGTLSQRAEP